ncbi:hypothetical protein H4R24_004818 [Coemansia sp. RSA 988]|nr:hypothetical protein H4R24_004818 [Coemansia sp. RSA 988]
MDHGYAVDTNIQEQLSWQTNNMGSFKIKRKLGSGTYGSVFKAKHISTKRSVALKFVKYNRAGTKSARRHNERIEREIKLQSLLHHPNIARLYDVIQLPDQAGMVLEYVKGCDLLDYVNSYGRLREDEACRVFRQIVSAVDYMHRNCIVHRDLKLGNIMLDRSGQVRIIDFGFADTFEWGKQHNTFCGSPSYASPEIVCSVKYTGPEIDIWSMGIVLYYMLTGLLPFDGKTRDSVYAKIVRGVFPMPTFVSSEAQNLLLQMLAVNPNVRISMASIIEHPWTNKYYTVPVENHMPQRPAAVLYPNEQTLQKMPIYRFNKADVVSALACSDMADTPIVSIYHLVDESRQRKALKNAHYSQQCNKTYSSVSSLSQ